MTPGQRFLIFDFHMRDCLGSIVLYCYFVFAFLFVDCNYDLQVIFTNESNIDRWKNKRQVAVDSKIGRLNNFIKLVKVPIQVFASNFFSFVI